MAVLLIAEHNNKELRPFTLNAATAASQIDSDVHAVIIGQDNLTHLDQWKNYERILDIGVYVYPRDIESESNGTLESHPNVKICDCKLMEISSSEIRDNISKGLNINHLVPDQVIELINKNKLYSP